MKPHDSNGWIYVIECDGFVKVGMTAGALERRLDNYRTHNPVPLDLLRSFFVQNPAAGEERAHRILFSNGKPTGFDWVKKDDALVSAVIQELEAYEKESPAAVKKPADAKKHDNFAQLKIPFTMVANCVLNNKNLTARAKGIYAYLYSKPDDWDFSYLRIARDHKESKNTILAALQELERAGYLERRKLASGRTEYLLTYEPETKDWAQAPKTKVRRDQTSERPKVGHVSNTDSYTNTDKDTNTSRAEGAEEKAQVDENSPIEAQIGEVIFRFQSVNPSYKTLFNRKPQREAARNLLEQFGFQKVVAMVSYLEHSNGIKYAPTITTPAQLVEKMGELKAWADKQRNGSKGKGIISAVPTP